MSATPSLYRPALARRRLVGRAGLLLFILLSLVALVTLGTLLYQIARQGLPAITTAFLANPPSVLEPESAGVYVAIIGTLWLIIITTLVAVPVGVAAAVWLEEYAPRNIVTRFIHLNIANLAGVPSIVYGLLGLAIFVRWSQMGRSVLAGGLTLALLVLPVIIIATREALAAVPQSLRHAALALGATRWQAVRHHVLPAALPGILTGVILSLSRAIGEAAPLIMIGAVSYVATPPGGSLSERVGELGWFGGLGQWLRSLLTDGFTALPVQIYNWSNEPEEIFKERLAAGAIIVLLAVLFSMNAIAIGIRAWQQNRRY